MLTRAPVINDGRFELWASKPWFAIGQLSSPSSVKVQATVVVADGESVTTDAPRTIDAIDECVFFGPTCRGALPVQREESCKRIRPSASLADERRKVPPLITNVQQINICLPCFLH